MTGVKDLPLDPDDLSILYCPMRSVSWALSPIATGLRSMLNTEKQPQLLIKFAKVSCLPAKAEMHDGMFSDGGLQLWQLQAYAKLLLTQDMS